MNIYLVHQMQVVLYSYQYINLSSSAMKTGAIKEEKLATSIIVLSPVFISLVIDNDVINYAS